MDRKWVKIGAGAGAGILTLAGFITFLVLTYGFQIIDVTGDIACDGTSYNPCISEFIVKNPTKYNVDIYSANQTKLDFSPDIKDYALFVKDGRCSATGSCRCELKDGSLIGFKGWRCIDFTNETKPLKDKVYNFRFPEYSETNFLIYGLKNNPNDTIKWGFGINYAYLDPIWEPTKRKVKIIPNCHNETIYYNVTVPNYINETICYNVTIKFNCTNETLPNGTIIINATCLNKTETICYNITIQNGTKNITKNYTIQVCNPLISIKDKYIINYTAEDFNCTMIEDQDLVQCDSCKDGNCNGICEPAGGEMCALIDDSVKPNNLEGPRKDPKYKNSVIPWDVPSGSYEHISPLLVVRAK